MVEVIRLYHLVFRQTGKSYLPDAGLRIFEILEEGISSMLYVKSLVQLLTSEISSYRWSKSWWMTLMMLFIASTKPGTGKSLFWLIPHVASTMARVREPRSILVISPYKVLTSAHMAEATEKLKQFQNIQFHN